MAASERDRTQRRVYVLPTELVDRIVEFQSEMGITSEVEAARRLLDEALKHRDDALGIAKRFRARLKETKFVPDIAREVLVGHPKIASINFETHSIQFRTTDGVDVRLNVDGSGDVGEGYGSTSFQSFAREAKNGTRGASTDLNDEIPF